MEHEIQRFCWFDTVGLFGSARETIWKYKRAIEGHKFILVDFAVDAPYIPANSEPCHAQIYDGHTYSHWGSFPNIFDQSTLRLFTANNYNLGTLLPLNNWECKEFTLSMRTLSDAVYTQFLITVFYYEVPMTKAEILEYAVKQPRYKYRHGGPSTVERIERGIID